HAYAHQAVQRIRVGERPEWTDVRVHDAVEHRMKDAAEDPAPDGDRHPILGLQCLGDDVSRSRQPATDTPGDEPAEQANQSAKEEGVRLAVDRVIAAQPVIAGLDVDYHLRHRVRRNRELVRSNGLEKKAGAEVEGGRGHGAPANLSGGRRMTRGAAYRTAPRRRSERRLDHHCRDYDREQDEVDDLYVPQA